MPRDALTVLVELRTDKAGTDPRQVVRDASLKGCSVDEEYAPVRMESSGTTIIRCRLAGRQLIDKLKAHPQVTNVWLDTPIAPMTPKKTKRE